ncbi:hypothetical protein EAF04_004086 [Stromatinia cepivora]|nr:hypothetical protein EAF04_004086 [Stromatinia cepivora]
MVQGALKSSKSALAGGNRANGVGKKAALGPKKGQRVIKAKREGLRRSEGLRKKHSAGLTAMTEKTLGAKAGHLELLGVGKKSKAKDGKGAESKGKGNAGATVHGGEKGGTRKFG